MGSARIANKVKKCKMGKENRPILPESGNKMNFKKVMLVFSLIIIVAAVIVLGVSISPKKDVNEDKIRVTVSNFASYDFLRAIIGETDNIELVFLLGPGKDTHSYELTAQDLITIQNSDVFVYIGENVENWSSKVLESMDLNNTKVLCIAEDIVVSNDKGAEESAHLESADGAIAEEANDEHKEDEHVEDLHTGHNHELDAFDEHIWTSPENAIIMIKALEKMISEIDAENASAYRENAESYIKQIEAVDGKIKEIIDNKVRDRLVFGDKMPMQYFIEYYDLEVSAAFTGCSTEAEPSASIIAHLVDTVRAEAIPVVLFIEMGNEKVANTIVNEVGNGCVAMQIQTLHNVSKEDFESGQTWVSLMERNLDVLRKALQ